MDLNQLCEAAGPDQARAPRVTSTEQTLTQTQGFYRQTETQVLNSVTNRVARWLTMEEGRGQQSRPHSTVEVLGGEHMDWELQLTSPASVASSVTSTQYSEVTSPSGDEVPLFESEVEVMSQEEAGTLGFSLKLDRTTGKIEPEGAFNKQIWHSLSEQSRKDIIASMQQQKRRKSDETVNDLKTYQKDIEEVIHKDVQKIPVKYLRKIIPEMRIFCYLDEEQYLGKKKLKHLWAKDQQPKDWPHEVPFLDPNNGDRNGPKVSGALVRGKPGKEQLIKMFEFLKKKYCTLNIKQPSDESNTTSCIEPLSVPLTAANPLQTLVEPAETKISAAIPTHSTLLVQPDRPFPSNDHPKVDCTHIVDSMYERLGSKFNQVAELATHNQDAQVALHNLICALQNMYMNDKVKFLRYGHQMEGILNLALFTTQKQENWPDFISQCRSVLAEMEPVKEEPTELLTYQVADILTNNNPFEAIEKPLGGSIVKHTTFGECLEVTDEDDKDLVTVKQDGEKQWTNILQSVDTLSKQDEEQFGVKWRHELLSADMLEQSIIEGRKSQSMYVNEEGRKRGYEVEVQEQAEHDQNFKNSTSEQQSEYAVIVQQLKRALKPEAMADPPMWGCTGKSDNQCKEGEVLNDVLDMIEEFELRSPQPADDQPGEGATTTRPSFTLHTGDMGVMSPPQLKTPVPVNTPIIPVENPSISAVWSSNRVVQTACPTSLASPRAVLCSPTENFRDQQQRAIATAAAEVTPTRPVNVPKAVSPQLPPAAGDTITANKLVHYLREKEPILLSELLVDVQRDTLHSVLCGDIALKMERRNGEIIHLDVAAKPPVWREHSKPQPIMESEVIMETPPPPLSLSMPTPQTMETGGVQASAVADLDMTHNIHGNQTGVPAPAMTMMLQGNWQLATTSENTTGPTPPPWQTAPAFDHIPQVVHDLENMDEDDNL